MADRAERFDRMTARLEPGWMTPSRQWVGARASGTVLEVGIGTGANLPHLRDVALTGVDVDDDMLRAAQRRAEGLGREVSIQATDGDRLPFDDASFDCVVATFMLCEVRDVRVALGEMLRVLRPGGSLLLADHIRSSNPLIHAGQWLVERITAPLAGEHWTRRPLEDLQAMGVPIVETLRLRAGIIENVHARAA